MSEPVRNFKQIIRIKGTGDDAYPNPGTLMLWGDNWTLLDWIRQHTDYSKDTRTTPVDVDVLTRFTSMRPVSPTRTGAMMFDVVRPRASSPEWNPCNPICDATLAWNSNSH